jgi:hypothetical protein
MRIGLSSQHPMFLQRRIAAKRLSLRADNKISVLFGALNEVGAPANGT